MSLLIIPEVDLHSHILPAVDDGAKDLTESLSMAKQAHRAGIRRIVATSHVPLMDRTGSVPNHEN